MQLSTMSEAELRCAAIEGLQARRAAIDAQIAELYARNGSAGEAQAHCVRKRGCGEPETYTKEKLEQIREDSEDA